MKSLSTKLRLPTNNKLNTFFRIKALTRNTILYLDQNEALHADFGSLETPVYAHIDTELALEYSPETKQKKTNNKAELK